MEQDLLSSQGVAAGLDQLARRLGLYLSAQGWRLATAESCTGGWVAKLLTDIPGSSRWFERGFVVYSNEAKCELLDVPAALIDQHGAVSGQVARAMVEGALAHSRAELALAITGIAGPGGGTSDKPVGTAWFGWGMRGYGIATRLNLLRGERADIRRQAVETSLLGLIEYLRLYV
ncbi:CinA family protein [Caldichromatium japonicum]|uniref:CinA family protein n=1 Tax=Caldichromatium japonicum TaxID=2699430 RepID=A0A6G7VCZ5_9GAMM|nr:CinA family protein [Caldichromatium japonicum]QIK37746.1 CinA family protein [Caldichromatium japonicum]